MAYLRTLDYKQSSQSIPLYRDINTHYSLKLDLNTLCIRHPTETFLIHIKNPNLIAWGIEQDDVVIVERSQEYLVNDLLVIKKNKEYKFYQFFCTIGNEKVLFSLDANEPNLRIQEWNEVNVEGIITNVIHNMRYGR